MTSSAKGGPGHGYRPPAEAVDAMVSALKEAERPPPGGDTSGALAQSAYERLQFDFPALPPAESQALARACIEAGGASGAPGLPSGMVVTATLLEGAGWLAQQEGRQHEGTAAGRGEGGGAGGGRGWEEGGSGRRQVVQAWESCPMQVVMGAAGLCGAVNLLKAPLEEALDNLASLHIQRIAGIGLGQYDDAGAGTSPPMPAAEVDAAVMDDDDTPYEDFLATGAGAPGLPAAVPSPEAPEIYTSGAEAFTHKLQALVDHISFPMVSLSQTWEDLRLGAHIIEALALLVEHPQADALEDVASRLSDLLAQAAAADPARMAFIEQALERLSAPGSPSKTGLRGRVKLYLLRAGLIGAKGQGRRSGRTVFWRAVQGQLPFLVDLLRDLQNFRDAADTSDAAEHVEAEAARGAWAQDLLHVCNLLEFHALEAPGGHSVGRDLLQSGALKSLTLLFGAEGANPRAEPLRRALLFACASGVPFRGQTGQVDLAAWCARVPSFRRALEEPAFLVGKGSGGCEVHGAVWFEMLGREPLDGSPRPLVQLLGDGARAAREPPGEYALLWAALCLLQCTQRAAAGHRFWGNGLHEELLRARDAARALPAPEETDTSDTEEKRRHLRAQCLLALKDLVGLALPGKSD